MVGFEFNVHIRGGNNKPAYGIIKAISNNSRIYSIVLENGNWPYGWVEVPQQNNDVHFYRVFLDRHDAGSSGELVGNRYQGGVQKGDFAFTMSIKMAFQSYSSLLKQRNKQVCMAAMG